MSSNTELIDIIRELVKIFHFERILYSISTILAFIILISCTIYALYNNAINTQTIIAMCGSSGVITFTCGRFLKMWSDVIKLVQQHFSK